MALKDGGAKGSRTPTYAVQVHRATVITIAPSKLVDWKDTHILSLGFVELLRPHFGFVQPIEIGRVVENRTPSLYSVIVAFFRVELPPNANWLGQ